VETPFRWTAGAASSTTRFRVDLLDMIDMALTAGMGACDLLSHYLPRSGRPRRQPVQGHDHGPSDRHAPPLLPPGPPAQEVLRTTTTRTPPEALVRCLAAGRGSPRPFPIHVPEAAGAHGRRRLHPG
jgi:hypothetical protein